MDYRLLGTVEVRPSPGAAPLDLGSPLQRVLLGLLLTERDRSVSLDRIVEELWGEAAPADPEGSVHTYVSRLRRVLEPGRASGAPARTVVRTPAGYRLAVPGEEVDADRFAELASRARNRLAAGHPLDALRFADEALGQWRGQVLEDAGDREFAVQARTRLDGVRATCQEDRLAALLALGRPEEVIAEAEALVAAHPMRERPWVLLIDALHAAGRTADALARYAEVHRLLDDELGVAPGPALREAQARALRGEAPAVAPRRPAPSAPPPASIVGRERELELLTGLVDGLPNSGPRFVLLEGEAGIGKSRLAHEVTTLAGASGARVAWGRCHEDDDAPALWPWHQIMSSLTGGTEVALAAHGEGAFAAFERVLRALVEASGSGRVVVVVDDLHWADPASLRLLSFLAVELQHGPIAVLATSRGEVRDPVLGQVRATLARTPGFAHVALGPLSPAATGELVERVVGAEAGLDPGALADLHERSGGNPFFATELARVLSAGDGGVPVGVRDVVERRLGALPDECRAVLRLAAAAGQRFDVGLLQRAGDTDADVLVDALDAAETADLVRPSSPGRLAFAHALVREALLDGMPELRRARLHARLAAALGTTADPFEKAHHLVSGRPFTDARATVAACVAAAERAALDHAHENAARWWERALETVETEPDGELGVTRQDLMLQAGTSLARAGSWAAALRLLTGAIESSLDSNDTETAASAADQFSQIAGLWVPVSYGVYPDALVKLLEAAVDAAGEGDSPARVRLLAALSAAVHYGPDRQRGLVESARALAIARRTGREDLIATALAARLMALWVPGFEDEQIEVATELAGLSETPERAHLAVLALARRGIARITQADLDGGEADVAAAWEVTTRHELPLLQAQLVSVQASRATMVGELELAMELVDRAYVLTQRTQLYSQHWTDLVMRAFIWIFEGTLGERIASMPTAEATNDGGSEVFLTALALIQAGQPAPAAAAMDAMDGYREWPKQWDWLSITCFQAQIAYELAEAGLPIDPGAADALADRLLPYAGQIAQYGGIGGVGPVTVFLGMIESVCGRTADAERHLREAAVFSERHGMRPSLAQARLLLARLLAAQGDAEAAADEAAAALEIAEAVGMSHVAERARVLAHG